MQAKELYPEVGEGSQKAQGNLKAGHPPVPQALSAVLSGLCTASEKQFVRSQKWGEGLKSQP